MTIPSSSEVGATPVSLVDLFLDATRRYPRRAALVTNGCSYTYAELDHWSGAVARLLSAEGVGPGDVVALRMPPCAEVVAAMVGILRAGAAYVPLDLRNPAARESAILVDSGAVALVGEPGSGTPPGTGPRRVITTARVTRLREEPPERVRALPAVPSSALAYVIFTSGTTGRPKGVPVRHVNVLALVGAARRIFDFVPEDRWLLFHSTAFDFSVWEMWGALANGAALVIMSRSSARDPRLCLEVMDNHEISILNQTPTAFAILSRAVLERGACPSGLRLVIFGGERLSGTSLQPWVSRYGLEKPRLVNGYGITETTVFSTFHEIRATDLRSPESNIGRPLPGNYARLVDESGADVPAGVTGELWLAGAQVCEGYLNNPELTRRYFVTAEDPVTGSPVRYYRSGDMVRYAPNCDLLYEGRADAQVKIRGHRIELGEIEEAVCRLRGVADCLVAVRTSRAGGPRLVCAYTTTDGRPLAGEVVRGHARTLLPDYMCPAEYVRLDRIPLTLNGKADRAAVARHGNREAPTS